MSLPVNQQNHPGESPHHYFRNICIEFKKVLAIAANDINALQDEMEKFLNASKNMIWEDNYPKDVYHKSPGEKAVGKVWNEFKRYIYGLMSHSKSINPQDLINALDEVETIIKERKVK